MTTRCNNYNNQQQQHTTPIYNCTCFSVKYLERDSVPIIFFYNHTHIHAQTHLKNMHTYTHSHAVYRFTVV